MPYNIHMSISMLLGSAAKVFKVNHNQLIILVITNNEISLKSGISIYGVQQNFEIGTC